MEREPVAVPIVFIRDSKQASIAFDDPGPAMPVDQDDRAGIEEVITFLTQYAAPQ